MKRWQWIGGLAACALAAAIWAGVDSARADGAPVAAGSLDRSSTTSGRTVTITDAPVAVQYSKSASGAQVVLGPLPHDSASLSGRNAIRVWNGYQ
jgi:hypothetical protein